MDVPTLSSFLRPILTFTSVWNTGETSDIKCCKEKKMASRLMSGVTFHYFQKMWPFLYKRAELDLRLTNIYQFLRPFKSPTPKCLDFEFFA